jgi:predicted transglutaminase-like cysteine proteinase
MELKTIRLKSIVDLVNDNIQPVQDTDMDTEYHWKIADIEKEDIGIEDDNLIKEYKALPEVGEPGQMVKVDSKVYKWIE